jgi:hypothetical protein
MAIVTIPISQGLVDELEQDLKWGPIIDDNGRRRLDEEAVDRIGKMVVSIEADEHPPPHFHVRYNGEDASFGILDGKRLPDVEGLERFDRNIKKWWKKNLCRLVETWNDRRPGDCQVGPVQVPDECKKKDEK